MNHSFSECYRIKCILHGKNTKIDLYLIPRKKKKQQEISGEDLNVRGKIIKLLERSIRQDHHDSVGKGFLNSSDKIH